MNIDLSSLMNDESKEFETEPEVEPQESESEEIEEIVYSEDRSYLNFI